MIEAKVICDSVGEHSPRLTTFQLRYPRFIHGEFMTYRMFSRNASSSRAVPVSKNLEEVRSDELRASPVWWGREQKGMQSGEELDDNDSCLVWGKVYVTAKDYAQRQWTRAALDAAYHAEWLAKIGVHKSIANRPLEPFLHINVVATSCEPGLLNFFGQRLDKAAQPEIRELADKMWAAWNESEPRKLEPGQWHLPLVYPTDGPLDEALEIRVHAASLAAGRHDQQGHRYPTTDKLGSLCYSTEEYAPLAGQDDPQQGLTKLEIGQRVSVARCARVSYLSYETGRLATIRENLALYERLVGSQPLHASPAEHQCTPDILIDERQWEHPELHGNLIGWVQFRKSLPGENIALLPGKAIAPLPAGYMR